MKNAYGWTLTSERLLVHKGASGLWRLRRMRRWVAPAGARVLEGSPIPGGYTSQRTAFHAAVALTRDGWLWRA